ncbi:MAG: hypothetical protein HRU00_10285 [Myxococcales bacterium]|nr:hypothetical protein [Myxococcales bacterium]
MSARSIAAILGIAVCVGCFGSGSGLSEGQAQLLKGRIERYAENLRWGRVQEAAQLVHPDDRVAFVRFMRETQGRVRFTSFEVDSVEADREEATGVAVVTFRLYRPPRMEERLLVESQNWAFDADRQQWFLRDPDLSGYRGDVSSRD